MGRGVNILEKLRRSIKAEQSDLSGEVNKGGWFSPEYFHRIIFKTGRRH